MKDNWTEEAADGVAARATEAIWRQADFAAPVDAHLAKNVVLRAPEAVVQGRMAVATDALALLAALPDQTWYPEDAILDRPEGGAIVTALRRVVEARHDGEGLFGAPTGRRVRVRVMTETAERDGRISDIWRVTDRAALLSALGQTPEGWAHAALKARDPEAQPLTPALDLPAAHSGRGAAAGWGAVWADLVERAMEGAFGLFEAQYAPGAELSYPGGQTTHGPAAARGFWMGLRAAFPDGQFEVHHAMGAEAPLLPPRAALRWSLTGRHDGWGPFGAPTGAEVHVMGLSQAEFGPEGLRREWTLYDPGAVWMQIMLRKG